MLEGVKLSMDERQKLRELSAKGDSANVRQDILSFLEGIDKEKRTRQEGKTLKKLTTLYDTHDFWDT